MCNGLKVGEVAARAGVNVQTLRYYERLCLLAPPRRTQGNHRLYDHETVQLVLFIKKAQALGLSLAEVREIQQAERQQASRCAAAARLLKTHLRQTEEWLRRLDAQRAAIVGAIEAWNDEAGSCAECRGSVCHLIERCPEVEPRSSSFVLQPPQDHAGVCQPLDR